MRSGFHGLLKALIPALLVALVWVAWWSFPERPLRSWSSEVAVSGRAVLQVHRATTGAWTLVVPVGFLNPSVLDRVYCFDPIGGNALQIPTPDRSAQFSLSHPSDLTWFAWTDRLGSIHVVRLPDGSELLATPPKQLPTSFRASLASPDSRFLLIPADYPDVIEVWDISSGAKRTSIEPMAGVLVSWKFAENGRLQLICKDRERNTSHLRAYQLPDSRPMIQAEFKCSPGQSAELHEKEVLKVPGDGVCEWWDISIDPPRRLEAEPRPLRRQSSANGQYLVTIDGWNWKLEEPAANRIITTVADYAQSEIDFTVPFQPPSTPFDRHFLLFHRRSSSPKLTPAWLKWLADAIGYRRPTDEILICDPPTGRVLKRLPAGELIWPANSDVLWIEDRTKSDGITFHEWSLNLPRPPWWLWGLTAATAAWYLRAIWGRCATASA